MLIKIYRIHSQGQLLGVVASHHEDAAAAYALGKYGASADVEDVDVESALESGPVCILITTAERKVNQLDSRKSVRVLVPQ